MTENRKEGGKPYDLGERTYLFAKNVRLLIKALPRTTGNIEDTKQLVRASGSVGANYIEANEGLGKKDFQMHVRISRKEAKESRLFLRLLDLDSTPDMESTRASLIDESSQLIKIFTAILAKTE
jgi:four helix bundle protein